MTHFHKYHFILIILSSCLPRQCNRNVWGHLNQVISKGLLKMGSTSQEELKKYQENLPYTGEDPPGTRPAPLPLLGGPHTYKEGKNIGCVRENSTRPPFSKSCIHPCLQIFIFPISHANLSIYMTLMPLAKSIKYPISFFFKSSVPVSDVCAQRIITVFQKLTCHIGVV